MPPRHPLVWFHAMRTTSKLHRSAVKRNGQHTRRTGVKQQRHPRIPFDAQWLITPGCYGLLQSRGMVRHRAIIREGTLAHVMAQGCARQLCHSFAAQVGHPTPSSLFSFEKDNRKPSRLSFPTKRNRLGIVWESLGNPAAATQGVLFHETEYSVPIGTDPADGPLAYALPVHGCRCSAVEKK